MKITLVTVGETWDKQVKALAEEYAKRIERYSPLFLLETTEEKLPTHLERFERVFLLDEHGKEMDTKEFANLLGKEQTRGANSLAFVIGGAYGFSGDSKAKASGLISLSKMTFPHQLVRVIFLEQLYRAFTILRNEKYHHE